MGKRDGWGIEIHPNGVTYAGRFEDSKYDGQGLFISPNGDIETGEWKAGTKQEKGWFF